jgi:hypothetical protein
MNTTKASAGHKDDLPNEQLEGLKRSKSWGRKEHLFIYRYTDKDGDVRYSKNRHGITCYVDPTFPQNEDAHTKFLKQVGPIEMEDVVEGDKHIDRMRMDNFVKARETNAPMHYLLPNCEEPYRPEKYSIRYKRKQEETAEKQ